MIENEDKRTSTEAQKRKIRKRYKGISENALEVIPSTPQMDFHTNERRQRVAVYARVSTDDPRQTSSYELQKNHYEDMVNHHPNWDLVNIYADEGISGTSLKHRNAFIQMIEDCHAQKIDLILTKSVSRFARNIIDCIGYIRELKAMNPPIGIFFETENIYSLNPNSEMSLSFIATLAQEESHTKSEIMNSSIEMRFKRGIFLTPPLLGYDHDINGNLIINEEEAKTVRLIFFMYLYGFSTHKIAERLTKLKRKTKKGNTRWSHSTVLAVLQNERHCGDVLARKTWTPNYLDHKSKKNKKDRTQYLMKGHHESIVTRDDFIAVQRMIANAKYGNKSLLPELNVIHEGVLRGFVSINPRWAGFKAADYKSACNKAGTDTDTFTVLPQVKAKSGDFDLRGYEIARGQFFNMHNRISITFHEKLITFSTEAIRKFPNDRYIEILVHPSKLLIAIRPCSKEAKNALQWSTSIDGVIKPRIVRGTAFLPTIFDLMNWKADCKYRIIGTYHEKADEKVIIFNTSETEILMSSLSMNKDGEKPMINNTMKPFTTSAGKAVLAYPAEWTDNFGTDYYSHSRSSDVEAFHTNDNWNVYSEGKIIKTNSLKVTSIHNIRSELKEILQNIKENSNESNQQ